MTTSSYIGGFMSKLTTITTFLCLAAILAIVVIGTPSTIILADATEEPTAKSSDEGSLSDLDLDVVASEVTESITEKDFLGNTTKLTANDGFNLVVVTLKGNSPCTCVFVTRTSDFSAVWELESKDPKNPDYGIEFASAFNPGGGWSILQQGVITTNFLHLEEAKDLSWQVAFILPEKVTHFHVRFPVATKSEVSID